MKNERYVDRGVRINNSCLPKVKKASKARKKRYAVGLTFLLSFLLFATTNAQQKDFHSWAATPPMGWNSWDCFGPTVVEAEVKANADYMAKNLKASGWEYIIVDIRWYVGNDKAHGYNETDPDYVLDQYGRFQPAVNRFPSAAGGKGFKPLADYIHSKGLKFGIHIMRGIPVEAVKRNLPILGSKATAKDIYSTDKQCKWLKDMYTVVAGRDGAQEYYNSLFKLYASWGLDFVKVDDLSRPYHTAEVEMIRKAIDLTGRKIVLSTSPGETPLASAPHVQQHANMWRTVDDFWDNWKMLQEHFDVFARWNAYRAPGAWPDGDMLPIGKIGIRAERGNPRMTAFTHDEQYTLMTLWTIFRSPLMFGGNLPDNDAFTLSLLNNKEVLAVLKYSSNNKELFRNASGIAWVADDAKTGDKYVALFNPADGDEPVKIAVQLKELGFNSACKVRDLWSNKDLGKFTGEFAPAINKHGTGLYRISAK
ncbi:glycoside hydrolase family 27 protein [Mucilaginibacter paludis]|nr:glycoside hydrolase family 27 protein [Mucilaginibacter paludis]